MDLPEFAARNIRRTISLARARCFKAVELIAAIRDEPAAVLLNHPEYAYRLGELDASDLPADALAEIAEKFAQQVDALPSDLRSKGDRLLQRIMVLLGAQDALRLAWLFILHRRSLRRRIGLRILADSDLDSQAVAELVKQFIATKDQWFLKVIARSKAAENLALEQLLYLLHEASDEYWRCRVLEHILQRSPAPDLVRDLSEKYPSEVIHAIGRLRNPDFLQFLETQIEQTIQDVRSGKTGLLIWALGRIGASKQLQAIEEQLFGEKGLQ